MKMRLGKMKSETERSTRVKTQANSNEEISSEMHLSITLEMVEMLYFPAEDALNTLAERLERREMFRQMGNADAPLHLFFEDIEGPKQISAKIQGFSEGHIHLENGARIPMHRVVKLAY